LRHTPSPAEHHDALREALVEVAESSFFAYVDVADPERFRELAVRTDKWIQATVLFDGAFGGAVMIVLSESLARELFNAFLGAEPGVVALDGPLFDLVGEFGNMVCGSWLTRTCQRRRFDLRHPEVSRVLREQVTPEEQDCLLLAINDQPCYVRLAFSGD
jgi:CheY-specific phosphatase CheX